MQEEWIQKSDIDMEFSQAFKIFRDIAWILYRLKKFPEMYEVEKQPALWEKSTNPRWNFQKLSRFPMKPAQIEKNPKDVRKSLNIKQILFIFYEIHKSMKTLTYFNTSHEFLGEKWSKIFFLFP